MQASVPSLNQSLAPQTHHNQYFFSSNTSNKTTSTSRTSNHRTWAEKSRRWKAVLELYSNHLKNSWNALWHGHSWNILLIKAIYPDMCQKTIKSIIQEAQRNVTYDELFSTGIHDETWRLRGANNCYFMQKWYRYVKNNKKLKHTLTQK